MEPEFHPFSKNTPFLVHREGNILRVKLRNSSSDNIDLTIPPATEKLKIKSGREYLIDIDKIGVNLQSFRQQYQYELALEEILHNFRVDETKIKVNKIKKKDVEENILNLKLLRARDLIKQGYSSIVIADNLKIKLSQVGSIMTRMKAKKRIQKSRRGRKLKLKREHLSYLRDLLRLPNTRNYTMEEFRKKLLVRFNLPNNFIKLSGFTKSLKKRLKLTWKQISPYKKNQVIQKTLNERCRFIKEILPYLRADYQIIFIDECSFNLDLMTKRAWGFSNEKIFRPLPEKSKNYSLMAAITKEKIISYVLIEGPSLTENYSWFIESIVRKLHAERTLSRSLFVADNCNIHKSVFFKEFLKNKVNSIYLGAYSPELNPIELLWPQIRNSVKKGGMLSNCDDLSIKIYNAIKNVEPIA